MKYIVVTKSNEVVFGADGICSKKQAYSTSQELVESDYGQVTIYKLVPVAKVKKQKPTIIKK
jgi:hypothetical protein